MPKLKRPLVGPDEKGGPSHGRDVVAVKRALRRVEDEFFPRPKSGFDDVFNRKTVEAVEVFQRMNYLKRDGIYGQATHEALWPYFDPYAKWIYRRYEPPPPRPKLVEPRQGYSSLHRSLWPAYSIGRSKYGLSDLGTYNPASRLPSGRPSDHAIFPAYAFDLGMSPATGYAHPQARAFFQEMIGRPEVEYVILGDRIWSRNGGLRTYTGGGHLNHVHVSGIR